MQPIGPTLGHKTMAGRDTMQGRGLGGGEGCKG